MFFYYLCIISDRLVISASMHSYKSVIGISAKIPYRCNTNSYMVLKLLYNMVIFVIAESSTSDDTAVEQLVDTTDNSLLQHPKNPFESSDQIGQQYALLVEAVTTCIINRDIAIEDFRAFITEIIGSKQDDILFADYIGEVFELPSIKNAFEFFNRFSSSIDVELLELILEKFPCDQCNDYFITYKEKLTKSKYSEHIVPKLSAGEKFVSCTFRGLNDPDPICGDIIKGKSFCLAFDIRPCALRLVECCKPKEVVTLKWQVFPKSVEIFQEELSDDSLQKLAPLKLKSLQVETTRLYFYCLPNVTQETSDTVSMCKCEPLIHFICIGAFVYQMFFSAQC